MLPDDTSAAFSSSTRWWHTSSRTAMCRRYAFGFPVQRQLSGRPGYTRGVPSVRVEYQMGCTLPSTSQQVSVSLTYTPPQPRLSHRTSGVESLARICSRAYRNAELITRFAAGRHTRVRALDTSRQGTITLDAKGTSCSPRRGPVKGWPRISTRRANPMSCLGPFETGCGSSNARPRATAHCRRSARLSWWCAKVVALRSGSSMTRPRNDTYSSSRSESNGRRRR